MYQGYNKIPLMTNVPNLKGVKCWYITEKVHGSCFCFIINTKTKEVTFGKRKGVLQDNETFFGYQSMLPNIIDKIHNITNQVLLKYSNVLEVHIFGELFGSTVQNGIYYSDDLHFYAFDISYIDNDLKEIYLDFEESLSIFTKVGILHAKPLAKFTRFEQAVNFDHNFQSTIPQQLGKPFIGNNKAEGIVIRSSNGRHLLKRKIDEFSESRFQDNEYENDNISPLELHKKLALKCLTENRLNNAISKYGEYDKYKELILEELCLDILTEINGFQFYGLKEWLDEQILLFVL
jgi:Rnl2 family RNA ligase